METGQGQTNIPSATKPAQETIFSDMLDTTPYQKHLKTARIWLYVITALQVGMGIYEYSTIEDSQLALFAGLVDAGIGVLFLLFAFLSYKRPVASFIAALVAYVVIHVGMMFLDPSNIYKGIILKIVIVVALIRAISNARDIQRFQETIV